MKRFILGAVVATACSVSLSAQSTAVKSETKVTVKDGKDVTVTGCLGRAADGNGFMLTDVEGRDVKSRSYILVGDDDLDDHLGHLIEVKGKASNIGDDARVEVKTKTKIERENADDSESKSTTKLEGDLASIPYLGVKSVKKVRSTCS
jgi:hypothetical protein